MKSRLKEIQSRAIDAKEKLSYSDPDQRKHITTLDRIIRGTTYVKWMLLVSLPFFFVFLVACMVLFYPDVKLMTAFAVIAFIGCIVCWLAVVIQAKLYDHAINKAQKLSG